MALTYYIRSWDPRSTYPTNPQEGDICYTITLDQTWAPVGGVKKDNIVKEEVYQNGAWVEQGGGGSSDFTTANVTLSGSSAMVTYAFSDEDMGTIFMSQYPGGDTITTKLPLYNGKALMFLMDESPYSVTGDITYSADEGGFIVTGDGTITFV